MPDFQKMYHVLFNAITDAINTLQQAQQQAEELYISVDNPNITLLQKPDADNSEGDF